MLNADSEAIFRKAADGATCVAEVARKLPTWAASQINHFNKHTGLNIPFVRPDPDAKAKALPGRACPKPGPKPAKGSAKDA